MPLNKDDINSKLNKLSCFENNPNVAVGVSGGPDSMALVYIVNKWIKKKKWKIISINF